jgi:hypothetical protein
LLKAGDPGTNILNLATALHRDALALELTRTPGWTSRLCVKVLALDPSKGRDARRGDYSAYVLLGIDARGLVYVEADLARRPTPQLLINQLKDFLVGDHDDGPDALQMALRLAQELLEVPPGDGLGDRLRVG